MSEYFRNIGEMDEKTKEQKKQEQMGMFYPPTPPVKKRGWSFYLGIIFFVLGICSIWRPVYVIIMVIRTFDMNIFALGVEDYEFIIDVLNIASVGTLKWLLVQGLVFLFIAWLFALHHRRANEAYVEEDRNYREKMEQWQREVLEKSIREKIELEMAQKKEADKEAMKEALREIQEEEQGKKNME